MKPPFSYYGGKQRIVSKIIPHIPPHAVYVEPFCGGATVLFQKGLPNTTDSSSYRETINDMNGDVVNFFRVLRDDGEELCRRLSMTLYSREEHHDAVAIDSDAPPIDRACAFFVNISQSFSNILSGAWGVGKHGRSLSATWKNRVDRLPEYIDRMRSIHIENKDALKVIKQWDAPQTFFYIDPPYPDTDCGHYGGYTRDDFSALVEVLKTIQGSFILSCYPQEWIELPWKYFDFETAMSAVGGKNSKAANTNRVERIWVHYTDADPLARLTSKTDAAKIRAMYNGGQ